MKAQYEVIVVGSGTGGAAIAKFLGERGIDVALLEKGTFAQLHKICGDATLQYHFDEVSRIDPKNVITPPSGSEVYQEIQGYRFYSPDLNYFHMPNKRTGWVIARDKFGARLRQEAEAAGAHLFEEVTVLHPLFNKEQDQVLGVTIRTKDKQTKNIRAHIVVDASGMAGVIRKHIDAQKAQWDSVIQHYDIAAAYREIVQFDNPINDSNDVRFYFDSECCPGGYFWIFPQSSTTANVGLGIEPRRMAGGPKAAYQMWKEREATLFNGSEQVIHKGGATVSLRRPMDTLVYNGTVLIGDAGACVRATDGGGLGLSLTSASYAAGPIEEAIRTGDYSREGPLWSYNVQFMRNLGAREGPMAIIKNLLSQTTNKTFNTLLDKKILTADDLDSGSQKGSIHLGIGEIGKRLWRGRTELPFFIKLGWTTRRMRQAKTLYQTYPDNWADFLQWKKQIVRVFRDKKRAIAYYRKTNQQQRRTGSDPPRRQKRT